MASVNETVGNDAECRVLTMPFPNNLTAHNTGNWRAKEKHVSNNRAIAKLIALNGIASGVKPIKGPHVICYRLFVPDNRRRDAANMIQQCKPYIDGLVDSGLIEGDHWQVSRIGFVRVAIDKERPRVEVLVMPDRVRAPQ